jgi:hypothetical protein
MENTRLSAPLPCESRCVNDWAARESRSPAVQRITTLIGASTGVLIRVTEEVTVKLTFTISGHKLSAQSHWFASWKQGVRT